MQKNGLKKLAVVCTVLCFPVALCMADLVDRVRAYVVLEGGSPELVNVRGSPITVFVDSEGELERLLWSVRRSGIIQPDLAELPDLETATTILEEYAAGQVIKPPMQELYENAFFDLIDELLVLTDNEEDPTPKLGFPELQALIAQVQGVDPMVAVNLSLNLLTIDAALKRYDTMWWDAAIRHELEE